MHDDSAALSTQRTTSSTAATFSGTRGTENTGETWEKRSRPVNAIGPMYVLAPVLSEKGPSQPGGKVSTCRVGLRAFLT